MKKTLLALAAAIFALAYVFMGCVGSREEGEALVGNVVPLKASAVSAGGGYTLCIGSDGSLWAWGYNVRGGDQQTQNSPIRVGAENDWAAVSAFSVPLGIKSDGSLWLWGGYDWHSPTRVGTGTDWAAVSAGSQHRLGIKKDGSLWAWGRNFYGELGLGDQQYRNSPTRVGSENNWAAVSAGDRHTLGIKKDGSLWAWGNNLSLQLGLGYIDASNLQKTPARVGTGTDWAAVSAGWGHTLGIKSDGSLWAWGDYRDGQLGLGDNQYRDSPTRVGTGTDWAAVSAGYHYTLGIKKDGTVWAWGRNGDGQLGLGDNKDRNIPVQVKYNPAK